MAGNPAAAERRVRTRERGFAARAPLVPFLRFTIGLLGVVLFFWAMLLAQKALFVWFNWDAVWASGSRAVAHGLAQGLRFVIYAPGFVTPGVRHVVGQQLDIIPTVLGLLDLKTLHSSWGHDLLRIPDERGFAVSVAGAEIRWRDRRYLLADGLTGAPPLLCDLSVDPACRVDVRPQNRALAEDLQTKVRAFLSLSQTLMYRDRVHPRQPPAAGG